MWGERNKELGRVLSVKKVYENGSPYIVAFLNLITLLDRIEKVP
jgi:hypothetical protein